jgi:hypothetical protein
VTGPARQLALFDPASVADPAARCCDSPLDDAGAGLWRCLLCRRVYTLHPPTNPKDHHRS